MIELSEEKREELRYYYALYHMLTYWTAYLTTLALLITIGLALTALQPIRTQPTLIVILGSLAIIVLTYSESYFLLRNFKLASYVDRALRDNEGHHPFEIRKVPARIRLTVLHLIPIVVALWDIYLTYR